MVPSPTSGVLGVLRVLLPVVEHVAARGVDADALLRDAGIDPALADDPDARISRAQQEKLWSLAVERSGDPLLAARVGQDFPLEKLGIILYVAKASSSGGDAVERLQHIVRLIQDLTSLELSYEPGLAVLHVRNRVSYTPSLPACEYNVALQVFIGRKISPEKRPVAEVRIPHPAPAHAAAFEEMLGVPVRYDAECCAVAFPRPEFDQPLPSADDGLRELLERYARDMLARVPETASFADRVRGAVEPRLAGSSPGLPEVAELLSMSERSVRRRLADEGLTYRALLDAIRREHAERALADGQLGMDAIARELGFADTSAFYKAYRRWTGHSPRAPAAE